MPRAIASVTETAEDRMLAMRARFEAFGDQEVSLPGAELAELIAELARLSRVNDDLQDAAADWQDQAEAWRVQATYLRDVVEHQRRVIALVKNETEDPEALAVKIEADDMVLFSDDTIQAIWAASVITAPPAADDH